MAKLTDKAMVSVLRISQYTGQRFDRSTTAELTASKGARSDAARVNLHLFPKEAFARVQRAAGQARTEHYRMTVPYGDIEGIRLLPATLFYPHREKMQNCAQEFNEAADEFDASYSGYLSDAQRRMNGLFRADFYPARADVRALFAFSVAYDPLSEPEGLRAELFGGDDKLTAEMVADAASRQNAAVMAGVRHVWNRIRDVVSHMSERLKAYSVDSESGKVSAPFRDSLVTNVRDICALLPDLNFTGDPDLTAMHARLEKSLTAFDPEVLRTDEHIRRDVALEADKILADLAGFIE